MSGGFETVPRLSVDYQCCDVCNKTPVTDSQFAGDVRFTDVQVELMSDKQTHVYWPTISTRHGYQLMSVYGLNGPQVKPSLTNTPDKSPIHKP